MKECPALFEKSYESKMKKQGGIFLGYTFIIDESKLKSVLKSMLSMHIENCPLVFSVNGGDQRYMIEIDNSSYTKSIFAGIENSHTEDKVSCFLGRIIDESSDDSTRYVFNLDNRQALLERILNVDDNGKKFIFSVYDCLNDIVDSYSNRR